VPEHSEGTHFIHVGMYNNIRKEIKKMMNNRTMNGDNYFFSPINIINRMRSLWEEHAFWSREFIVSAVDGLKDLQPVTNRLLRNPTDFGDFLEPFYGQGAREFEKLLREHLLLAGKLVTDAKKGDTKAADADRVQWYQNADQIAALLASLNPYWSFDEWRDMLHMHLRMIEDEATNRLKGQYGNEIMVFDSLEEQARDMADVMSMGIINQFQL